MRMRKKKNGAKRLEAVSEFLLDLPTEPSSDPGSLIDKPGAEVYLEIGAGKGGFACAMAELNRGVAYFAMEKVSDCVLLACERASKMNGGADNLRFVIENADRLLNIFEKGSIDRIFLNFSDPWTKKGYAKRRLTHRRYLALYMNLLKEGGRLTFKTDNDQLFEFSLEEISAMGLSTDKCTRDLHNSEYNVGNVMTEYEKNFTELGKSINMLEITKPQGYAVDVPTEFLNIRTVITENDR